MDKLLKSMILVLNSNPTSFLAHLHIWEFRKRLFTFVCSSLRGYSAAHDEGC